MTDCGPWHMRGRTGLRRGPSDRIRFDCLTLLQPVETLVAKKRNRLSFRIPWLLEAVAEGPLAIGVLLIPVIFLTLAKGMAWW